MKGPFYATKVSGATIRDPNTGTGVHVVVAAFVDPLNRFMCETLFGNTSGVIVGVYETERQAQDAANRLNEAV